MRDKVVLKVRNPRADIRQDEPHALPPRIDTLDGKHIAVMAIKPDANIYLDRLTEMLRERYPTATFDRFEGRTGPFVNLDPKLPGYDAYIYGVKNTAGFNTEAAPEWEINGTPGVTLVTDFYLGQTGRHAMSYGVPFRFYAVPCEKWSDVSEVEDFYKMADDSIDDIIKLLTDPLTEAEKNPKKFEYDISDLEFEGEDYTEAYEKFQQYFMDHHYTDGLAVAPPTQKAVDEMLKGTSRKPDEVLCAGEEGVWPKGMTPTRGIPTIEKIAINAVMAGAKPEYLPVIITACEILCDPKFDAFHPMCTVTSSQLMIAINGPIAKEIGMNCEQGYLGPGTQANSTIGRAVSLCVINIGWLDFAVDGGMTGQPSRYCNLTFCENTDLSPWEEFSVTRGFDKEDSTVTVEEVVDIDGYWWAGVSHMPSGSVWTYGLENDLHRIAEQCQGNVETKLNPPKVKNVNHINYYDKWYGEGDTRKKKLAVNWVGGKNYALIIFPGEARQFFRAGIKTKEDLKKYIANYRRCPWEKLSPEMQENMLVLAKSGEMPYLSVDDCKPGGTIPVCNVNKLAIFVSGPMAGQTLGLSCMCSYDSFGPNAPQIPYTTRKITGATLTKAGK